MHPDTLKQNQKEWHGSYKAYLIGFIASITLTLIAFFLALSTYLRGTLLISSLIGLALLQAVFQVRYFLHVGQEPKPRWETLVFLFMVLVLFIVVLGTLWIMFDLNHRVMFEMAS